MKIFAATERLILRELIPEDAEEMFVMDSDPEVHRYVGKAPVIEIGYTRDVIQMIRQQYTDNGIGRWAVIQKETGHFIGWAGLKLMREEVNGRVGFYDLGYRFARKYWGFGYATEAAIAARDYGFEQMGLMEINAMADIENTASKHVLEKAGLSCTGQFERGGDKNFWFSISREKWLEMQR